MATAIKSLRLPAEYQAERQNVFPSMSSLNWFVRQHRDHLVQRGALVAPAGRKLIEPDKFDSYVMRTVSGRCQRRG
jgi:hypothetical protein